MRGALPRLLLGAPASGGGKTTLTCGLLKALVDRGEAPTAFKCGPDYIDPMFHSEVIGAHSRNLDLFLLGEDNVRALLWENGRQGSVALLEGAMGYYDGIAMSPEASAWDLAVRTQTPSVLVLDARGRALSAAALVKGFTSFRSPSQIQGVVLNRISPMLYPRLRDMLEYETGVKVYGFLPECPECMLESRHLGLVPAAEVAALREKLSQLAAQVEENVDIEGLLELARSAPDLEVTEQPLVRPVAGPPPHRGGPGPGLLLLLRRRPGAVGATGGGAGGIFTAGRSGPAPGDLRSVLRGRLSGTIRQGAGGQHCPAPGDP